MALVEQIALTLLQNIGHRKIRTILQHIDTESFFRVSKRRLKEIPSLGEKTLLNLNRDEALLKAEQLLSYFEKNDISPIFFQSEEYPYRLNQCEDAPILLFKKGNMHFNQPKVIAIVGTRNATKYGKRCIDELLDGLKEQNVIVVSGLAYGIDIYAHQRCIELGIQTIGVLGHGLDRIYPSIHKNIANQMLENGGLLSEFLPGTLPDREHFPMRNRIVAGMCDALVVIESKRGGGSLITATIYNSYNKDIFAYPGKANDTLSEGCNGLIKSHRANLIESAADLLYMMNWNEKNNNSPAKASKNNQIPLLVNLSLDEQIVTKAFENKNQLHIDEVCYATNFTISKTSTLLLQLEFSNVIKSLPGKIYQMNR